MTETTAKAISFRGARRKLPIKLTLLEPDGENRL